MKNRSKWWWAGAKVDERTVLHLVRKADWNDAVGPKKRTRIAQKTACGKYTFVEVGVENPAMILEQWADFDRCGDCNDLDFAA